MRKNLKVVVLGGGGMIGSKITKILQAMYIEVVPASRRSGVDTMTGEGLARAFSQADVVVDVSDVHSFDPATLRDFFIVSGANVARAEREAGVRHHVTLSIVGACHLPGNPYYAAKTGQEHVARSSGTPCTIVRSTQFFEFLPTIAAGFTKDGSVRPPDAMLQPIAADDVAAILAGIAVDEPRDAVIEIAGPETLPIAEWIRRAFDVTDDGRTVAADGTATWFGAPLNQGSLISLQADRIGPTEFGKWASSPAARIALSGNRYESATAELELQIGK